MTIKVAINGFGRIGRNILRALYEGGFRKNIQIVAINDLADMPTNEYLFKYDSTHGRFAGEVQIKDNYLVVNGDRIFMTQERSLENLPWAKLDVDVVFECTGIFTSKAKSMGHIKAGAKKVIISAPAGKDVDATIVYGVNHNTLKNDHIVISNASCTTNCLAPLVKPLNEKLGIENGLMTTIHSYTNDQRLLDSHHDDMRRARSAALSMIPTKTGAAAAVGLVLPELDGKLDGFAIRVPTPNVSLVDLTFTASRYATSDEVNEIIRTASEGELKGILEYNHDPLVSIDYNHNPASSIFDPSLTRVCGNLVKVCAWYDNEWGFSNRMLDVAKVFAKK